ALHFRLNLASAAERQSRSSVPAVAALEWHLAFDAVFLPVAFNFALAQRLASSVPRMVPGGEPVSVVTRSSTNASTFASITPASPVDRQPPFVSALANLSANFPSILALHATRRAGLMTV